MIKVVFGGLAGALLSLIVSFIVAQRRLRGEVALKVVDYLQETYRTIEVFMVQRDFRSRDPSLFDEKVYKAAKLRLRKIVLNDAIRAQVAITFGEGDAFGLLNGIQSRVREIVETTWKDQTVASDWIRKQMEAVDEARNRLERQLLDQARAPWFLRPLEHGKERPMWNWRRFRRGMHRLGLVVAVGGWGTAALLDVMRHGWAPPPPFTGYLLLVVFASGTYVGVRALGWIIEGFLRDEEGPL